MKINGIVLLVIVVLLIIWVCHRSKEGMTETCLTEREACGEFALGMKLGCSLTGKGAVDCMKEADELYKGCGGLSSKCLDSTKCEEMYKGMKRACEGYATNKRFCKGTADAFFKDCKKDSVKECLSC